MSVITPSMKKASIGTPAQYAQPSRKGKKAWRKNVDIREVESGMEEIRAEERETGSSLQKKKDSELFEIDVKGDDKIRKSLPKFSSSQLSYNKIIAQRSAIPSVFSRPEKRGASVTYEDKTRLLRIAKRKRRGPLNSVEDPTELGKGSALLDPSHAVKESGKYDVWAAKDEDADVSEEKKEFLLPLVKKPAVKLPPVPNPRSDIVAPAVTAPHQGTSYNPPVDAHQELLRIAHEKAEKEEKMLERYASVKERVDAARKGYVDEINPGVPTGMTVDDLAEVEEDEGGSVEAMVVKKPTVPKTAKQRRKAKQLLEEKRALAERSARKRTLASIGAIKTIRKSLARRMTEREQERLRRRVALQQKMKQSGLAGRKLGKHVVPEGQMDVQLGEDLAESLRELKPEGNLFRDRFLSLQQRALVEPRVPVLPKKHRPQTKEVEKFAWKRFE